MASKRILVISDTHCGHLTGLTPPAWQLKEFGKSSTKRNKWATMQKDAWREFKKMLKRYEPYDMAFHLGDMIDGKGKRSGCNEAITADLEEQADMAANVCDTVRLYGKRNFKWYGVLGTNYHVASDGDNWDVVAANRAGFECMGSHEWIDVNGLVFDLKHKVGSSSIPHGRGTSLARTNLWNGIWAEMDAQPRAQIFLRGHTHYTFQIGEPGTWLALILPSLQGWTKFGGLECEGTVHWGGAVFDVTSKNEWSWHVDKTVLESAKAKAVKA